MKQMKIHPAFKIGSRRITFPRENFYNAVFGSQLCKFQNLIDTFRENPHFRVDAR